MPDRRGFLRGAGAAAAVALCGKPAAAKPLRFDPAAYLADVTAAGVVVWLSYPACHLTGDERPHYVLQPVRGRGFGQAYREVMLKWGPAIAACPDHVERVVAYAEKLRT